MYNKDFKKTFNSCLCYLLVDLFDSKTEFSIVIDNTKWDKPLPNDLSKNPVILLDIKEQVFEDSYYDEESFHFTIYFGDDSYYTQIFNEDIHAILTIDKQPIMIKPFLEEDDKDIDRLKNVDIPNNPYKNFKDEELTDEVKQSINCFIKNNPDRFK